MTTQKEPEHQMATPEPSESLGDLLGDLMSQSTQLVKSEVALAKAELHEKARLFSSAALIITIGGALGLLAAMALLAAGIIALASYTGLATSALIFAATLGAAATLLFKRGLRNFKPHSS